MTLTEAETRKKLVDEKLQLAGWNVNDPSQVIEEMDIDLNKAGLQVESNPNNPFAGHRFADYVLLHKGKPAAVIEVKRTSKDPALGKEQAYQYASNIQKIYEGNIPFIFYTNGYDIYFWESELYPPYKVTGFPTKDDLEWMVQRRESRNPLSIELINTSIVERDYQIAAIRSIIEEIEKSNRKFLLVMATGTGKTRTATALIDVLMRARWAKRVLFLVDRIALRDQALDAFEEFIPSEPRWPQRSEKNFAQNRRIYVTTYKTMLNLIENGITEQTWISPHFFDVVIADESHRSIYNIYKQVLEYFHAIKLGLTATPKDHIDFDTFKIFDCDTNDPTFAYSYQEAIEHNPPYLCDFEVLNVRSKFQVEGIKSEQLSLFDKKQLLAEDIDLDNINFEGTDLERSVTNSGTNALIVREFMEECIKDHTGTLPGKSIFFAVSIKHARRLQKLFDRLYPEHKGKLARVLVSEDRFVYGKGGLLDQFKNKDMPRVGISVDMLDTGIDIRELVNLVFAKPVYSYVKFWQMIGRGTRVLDTNTSNHKSWCQEKDKFIIIDCWNNFTFFKMNPPGREPHQQVPLPVRLFIARLEKLKAAIKAEKNDTADSVKKNLRQDITSLPKNNVLVLEKQADLAVVDSELFWQHLKTKDIEFLQKKIAPVLKVQSKKDFKAMQFELQVVDLETALLLEDYEVFETIKNNILNRISLLPLSVNIVAKEIDLIQQVSSSQWWTDLTDEKFRNLVKRIAPLMKYQRKVKPEIVKLDLKDLVMTKEWIEFGPEHERVSTSAYRERIEAYIKQLVDDNPVLQKIKTGNEVSDSEIKELANLLSRQDPYITLQHLRKAYDHKTARFIQFMRHILGLEKLESWSKTVTAAFDEFIAQHNTFSALQIRFIQTLRTFILQTGKVRKADLIEAPFTQIHPQGIRGIFPPELIEEIIYFTEKLAA